MSLSDNIFAAASALVLAVLIWAVTMSLIGAPAGRPRPDGEDATAAQDDAHCAALGFSRRDALYFECRDRFSLARRQERAAALEPSIL
jgi:hypothetical protein